MRISATARVAVPHVAVMLAALFAAACQVDAQVPLIRPARSPTVDIGRVTRSEAARIDSLVGFFVTASEDTTRRRKLSEELAALALYARDSPQQLFDAWRLQDAFPQAAETMHASGDSASRAVHYALAATKQTNVARLVEAAGTDSGSARRNLELLRETLEDVLMRYAGGQRATLFAMGDVKGVATGGESSAAATGALGLSVATDRATVQASLTLASTEDSLTTGFGAAVLTPGSGKALSSGLLSGKIELGRSARIGIGPATLRPAAVYLYGTAASSRWRDTVALAGEDGTAGISQPVSANAVVLGGGALAWHELACCRVLDNPAVLTLQWGVALRHLGGNITADSPEMLALRDSTLGTQRRTFWGPEFGVQITVNRVLGSLQLYHLRDGGEGSVPGLTGWQLVTAFTIAADIFSGPLTR